MLHPATTHQTTGPPVSNGDSGNAFDKPDQRKSGRKRMTVYSFGELRLQDSTYDSGNQASDSDTTDGKKTREMHYTIVHDTALGVHSQMYRHTQGNSGEAPAWSKH